MHQSLVQIVCCLFLQYVLISADPLASEFKDLREDENEFLSGKNFTVLPLSLPIPKFLDQNLFQSTPFPSQTHPVVVADAKNTKTVTRPGLSQKNRRRKGKRGKNGKRTKSNKASNNPRKNSEDFDESKDLEDQKEILRSTMRYMFGFDHMLTTPEMVKQKIVAENVGGKSDGPNSGEATKLKGQNGKEDEKLEALDLPEPPDFMLELYETYSKDNNLMMLHSRSQGDTIRSFFPSPADPRFREKDRGRPVIIVPVVERDGETKGALGREVRNGFQPDNRMPAFLFNLSSIPSEEELVSVEIRLDGRAKNYRSNVPSFQQDSGFGSEEANDTHPSSWNLKIGVYKIGRVSCRGEIDCTADDILKIFIKVGRTVVINSPAIMTWSDKELVFLARKARKLDHVMLVKFTRDPSAPNSTEELSRSSRHIKKPSENDNGQHHTSNDLPNTFTVPESERPKRNSDRTKSLASAQPFLSEPSQFGKEFNALDLLDSEFDISRVPMLIIYSNDSRTVEATEAPQISPLIWGALENVTASLTRRTRRSIDNISEMEENQLPEAAGADDTREYDPNILQTESDKRRRPFVVKKGRAQNRQTKRINNSLSNDQTELHDNEKSRRLLMDTLKDKRRRRKNKKCEDRKGRRRKGCRKGKKSKGKNIPPHESLEALNRAHLLCGRRSLHVDFADIGWSDWIISPNYFDAYYCSGRCEIPHMQSMQGTSNHAIIQALIKAIGVNKEIPAPCCVPEKLMSLSVLYYDEEKNVVLKVYRNMSVETCSCR